MLGINLQLSNGPSTPQADLTDIQVCWWDKTEPKDFDAPIAKASDAYTDSNGYLALDLSNVSTLNIGENGFLTVYKLNATNHENSLVFSGQVTTEDIISGIDMFAKSDIWVRPTDWPELDEPVEGEEKIQLLHPVFDLPNGTQCVVSAREQYIVDWGDGTPLEYVDNTNANHTYDFNSPELSVVTSEGFKCAVITVIPQDESWIDYLNLYNAPSGEQNTSTKWLEVSINAPNLTNLFAKNSYSDSNPDGLRCVSIYNQGGTNFYEKFRYLKGLKKVHINLAGVTNCHDFLGTCDALTTVTIENAELVQDWSYAFDGCTILNYISNFDTSSATNMERMFTSCNSLEYAPKINTSNVTNFEIMFGSCTSLKSIPTIDFSSASIVRSMFNSCDKLDSIHLDFKSKSLDIDSMFSYCETLRTVTIENGGPLIGCYAAFRGCTNLETASYLDTSNVSDISYMFGYCNSLRELPEYDFSSVTKAAGVFSQTYITVFPDIFSAIPFTDIGYLFRDMYTLTIVPPLDCSLVTNAYNPFYGSTAGVKKIILTNMSISFSVYGQLLDADALNDLFTSLATVVDLPEITITNNPGADTCDQTIATNKGWVVIN